ncbi:cytochrome c-type biogenesis protein [Parvularcula sp. LCG005]|uniref:cytochrome c-type biogenesis protein n=1 Tax=Parvularcula sp. LCG005 TaxID=3078805 RepID=UPI0029433880|nr:cytochrome c-type biogenesis protein [Parvularcula sp. LCG005]WOI53071.1 cytochrome c-type biogenesis protein [Parvularcula sp. LCG005]
MIRMIFVLACLLSAAMAQDGPDDAEIDARVEEVAKQLRCVVCKNQSIAESDAPLAQEMVQVIREQIEAGATNEEAAAYITGPYGEFVLLKPRLSRRNMLLWSGPFLILLLGGGLAVYFIRQRQNEPVIVTGLTSAERRELDQRLSGRNDEHKKAGPDGPA